MSTMVTGLKLNEVTVTATVDKHGYVSVGFTATEIKRVVESVVIDDTNINHYADAVPLLAARHREAKRCGLTVVLEGADVVVRRSAFSMRDGRVERSGGFVVPAKYADRLVAAMYKADPIRAIAGVR